MRAALSRLGRPRPVASSRPRPAPARRVAAPLPLRAATDAPPAPSPTPAAAAGPVAVEFEDADGCTLLTLAAPGADGMLAEATGVLDALDLAVQSAAIHRDGGEARLAFRLADPGAGGGPLPAVRRDGVRAALAALWGGGAGALSAPPAIYGVVAEAEVKRLRPLSSGVDVGEAAALELAAAEMAAAAAELVSVEREVAAAAASRDAAAAAAAESRRTEAAAVLERRMAAMEAALAARRTLAVGGAAGTAGGGLAGGAATLAPEREAPPDTAADPFAAFRPPAVAAPTTSSGPAAGNGYELILQAFNWESHRGVAGPGPAGERTSWYAHLLSRLDAVAEAGFTSVWLPPPSDSVSPQGYLPRDLYKLDSAYGSEAELRALVGAMRDRGLKAVADIVINHRCAHGQDEAGRWNRFGGRLPWDETAVCCNNPAFGGRGGHKTGEDYVAAPNIDHTNERVRSDLARWLAYLRTSIGFDGWRFDFVKGYAGHYAREYIDATVPALAFGEFWDTCGYTDGVLDYNQDAHRQRTVNWCDATGGTAAAFDFTTKGVLQEAMARGELWRLSDAAGRPPGVMGLWPSRAVTMLENHDTGSTLNHWPFPHNHLPAGHAYLLTHPGTPCVFWDHFTAPGLGDHVRALLKARRSAGLHARSAVKIQRAAAGVYAATVDDRIAVKVGPADWSPGAAGVDVGQRAWTLETSGPQFAVWRAEFR